MYGIYWVYLVGGDLGFEYCGVVVELVVVVLVEMCGEVFVVVDDFYGEDL